jgi:uncharacterized membrane protein
MKVNEEGYSEINPALKLKNNYILNEINRENLLYKSLFTIVAYFCVGTELRFLAIISP